MSEGGQTSMITTWLWKSVEQTVLRADRFWSCAWVATLGDVFTLTGSRKKQGHSSLHSVLKPQETTKTCVCPEDTFSQPWPFQCVLTQLRQGPEEGKQQPKSRSRGKCVCPDKPIGYDTREKSAQKDLNDKEFTIWSNKQPRTRAPHSVRSEN